MQRPPVITYPDAPCSPPLAVAALALAACGSDDASTSSADPAAPSHRRTPPPAPTARPTRRRGRRLTPPPRTTPPAPRTSTPSDTAADEPAPTIPPGTTLRIGDQGGGLETPLRLAGELDDLPYEVEFATFASGPLVNEAFAADAIDIGIMGDTPALLSYAAGLDTVVVGIRSSDGVAQTLVAAPAAVSRRSKTSRAGRSPGPPAPASTASCSEPSTRSG